MGVSENSGTPKTSMLIGFSIINHPFWGTTIFGNHVLLNMAISITSHVSMTRVSSCQASLAGLDEDYANIGEDFFFQIREVAIWGEINIRIYTYI